MCLSRALVYPPNLIIVTVAYTDYSDWRNAVWTVVALVYCWERWQRFLQTGSCPLRRSDVRCRAAPHPAVWRTYTVSHHGVFRYCWYSENMGAKTTAAVNWLQQDEGSFTPDAVPTVLHAVPRGAACTYCSTRQRNATHCVATLLFNESVHTNHMWSDLSSDDCL